MKITDDILKAIQRTVEGAGSIGDLAEKANVKAEMLSDFLTKKTKSVTEDTWEKIYPFIKPYIPHNSHEEHKPHLKGHLTSDQKILLDAFEELPKPIKEKKLIEIVELARTKIEKLHKKGLL